MPPQKLNAEGFVKNYGCPTSVEAGSRFFLVQSSILGTSVEIWSIAGNCLNCTSSVPINLLSRCVNWRGSVRPSN